MKTKGLKYINNVPLIFDTLCYKVENYQIRSFTDYDYCWTDFIKGFK